MLTTNDNFTEKVFAGLPVDHCTVIDAHGHLGEDARHIPADLSLESVIALMDRIGIKMHCVSANPGIYSYARRANAIVEEAIRRYPERFFGYLIADLDHLDTLEEQFETGLEHGFRGLKVWANTDGTWRPYKHPDYEPVFALADQFRLPVLAHTWGEELDHLQPYIEEYPRTNFLLAHTASFQKEKYIRFGREYPNVYLELCFSLSPRGLVEELVETGLVDKLIWGSDSTFMGAHHQIGRILFAKISPEDKEKILGINAKRALRLV